MKMGMVKTAYTLALAACFALVNSDCAVGQTTVTTVRSDQSAVIGYVRERRGLFGLRTSYRPIVGRVPVQKTVTVQHSPTYVAAPVVVKPVPVAVRPVPVAVQPVPVAVQPTPVVVTKPVPVAVPTTTYLAPAPPTPIPVTTYHTPWYPRY